MERIQLIRKEIAILRTYISEQQGKGSISGQMADHALNTLLKDFESMANELMSEDKGFLVSSEKPPLGLRPQRIAEESRLDEITSAIQQYIHDGVKLPKEWLEEYIDILVRLEKQNTK